jgi:hypothetical protein
MPFAACLDGECRWSAAERTLIATATTKSAKSTSNDPQNQRLGLVAQPARARAASARACLAMPTAMQTCSTAAKRACTDPKNCGTCGTVLAREHLLYGMLPVQRVVCCSFADCNGVPTGWLQVNLNWDAKSCGACGKPCPVRGYSNRSWECAGQPVPARANMSRDGIIANGCETHLPTRCCGACGNACAPGQTRGSACQ